MSGIKFVVSDETKNSHGFIVRTTGINTNKFEKNPVMLYMHDRDNGVVGRWENLRKEGSQLIADAVFDEGTELGRKVKHQVENGFLRCASIGIENCKHELINNIETITECELFEISIVDIPANENAVKLYAKGRKPVTHFFQLDNPENPKEDTSKTFRTRLIDLLGLEEDVKDNEIIEAVKTLLNLPSNADREVDEAIKNGLIPERDRGSFKAMAHGNIKAFRSYCKGIKATNKKEIEYLLSKNTHKILPGDQDAFRLVGERLGIEVLTKVLAVIPKIPRLSELLNKEDPEHKVKNLDYYRKNEPEYLKSHPEIYRQLIEKEQQKL